MNIVQDVPYLFIYLAYVCILYVCIYSFVFIYNFIQKYYSIWQN